MWQLKCKLIKIKENYKFSSFALKAFKVLNSHTCLMTIELDSTDTDYFAVTVISITFFF